MQEKFEYHSTGVEGPDLDPGERKPYTLDFTYVRGFAGETIQSVVWAVTNCTIDGQSNTSKTATVVLKSGVASSIATVTCTVTTTPSGYKYERSFKIDVLEL